VTSDPQPESLGTLLRSARLRMGEDLKSVSRTLKIKPEFLEALENENMDVLPGRTYALGFLRTYAEYLGLDPTTCVVRFKEENQPAPDSEVEQELGLPEIQEEVRLPHGTLIILAVLLMLAIYGGIYLFRAANEYMDQRAKAPPPVPPAQTQTAPPPADLGPAPGTLIKPGETATGAAEAPAEPVPEAKPPEAAAKKVEPAKAKPAETPPPKKVAEAEAAKKPPKAVAAKKPEAPPTKAEPAASATAQQSPAYVEAIAKAPKTFGAPTKNNRVMLRANAPVFVRVEADGTSKRVLFEGMLGRNDLYFVPGGADAVLVARNGGALDVFVDGEPHGHAGPPGIALKNLPLNPDLLKGPR
jgi:cytoskeleton protein RodZ